MSRSVERQHGCSVSSEGVSTYDDKVKPLHNQAGGQKHGPEGRNLVFPNCLPQCQRLVVGMTRLRLVDELNNARIIEVEVVQLLLSGDDLFALHFGDVREPGGRERCRLI